MALNIPIVTPALKWAARKVLGESSRSLTAAELQTQIGRALSSAGNDVVTREDMRPSSGWVFGAQRQIGGRAARVPMTLEMVRADAGRQRFRTQTMVGSHARAHEREVVWWHPFLDLIAKPNPDETGLVFHWRKVLQLNTVGKSYTLCLPQVFDLRTPDGESFVVARISEMRLLDPDRTTAVSENGRVYDRFVYRQGRGGNIEFRGPPSTPADIKEWRNDPYPFVFPNVMPDPAGYGGYGPTMASKVPLDTLEGLGIFHKNQLKNGLHAGLIFYMLQAEEDPKRFEKLVLLLKAGIGKAGEPMVLPKKRFEVDKSPVTNNDMQFAALSDTTRQETLSAIGASDSLVGLVKDVNRASIWALEHSLAVGTIDPVNELIADAYNAFLIPLYPGQSSRQWLEASYGSSRMVDDKEQADVLSILVKSQIIVPNEARADLGRPPVPWGDEPVKQPAPKAPGEEGEGASGDMAAAIEDGASEDRARGLRMSDLGTEEARDTKWRSLIELADKHEAKMRDALSVVFEGMGVDMIDTLSAHGDLSVSEVGREYRTTPERAAADDALDAMFDPEEWEAVLREVFDENVPPAMVEMMEATFNDVGLEAAFTVVDPRVAAYVERRSFEYVTQILDTTKSELRDMLVGAIDEGISSLEFADLIGEKFDEYAGSRSVLIARNEVNQAQNHANYEAVTEAEELLPDGLVHMWLSARDTNTRPTHRAADGQTVKIGEKFQVGSCRMLHPQDVANCSDASETIQCRCRSVAVKK